MVVWIRREWYRCVLWFDDELESRKRAVDVSSRFCSIPLVPGRMHLTIS